MFTLIACGGGSNKGSGDPDDGQNDIEDKTQTYASIGEAVDAVATSLTDDQKNSTLPDSYVQDTYAITTSGDYYFTGNLSNAITVAKNTGNVHIYLDNVTLNVTNSAAFSSKSGASVTITLIGNNSLSNDGDTTKNVIDSKENLVINGAGTLTGVSTKSCISCDKTFIGLGGSLTFTAANHGIKADSIYIDGLTINTSEIGKDIIHAESDYDEVENAPAFNFGAGFVYIKSGGIDATGVLGDGIQADSFVYIKDGTFNIQTVATWNDNYVAQENNESGCFNRTTHQKVSRDEVRAGSTYAVLEESVKGIKVGEIDYALTSDLTTELTVESEEYTILIEGGTFTFNTPDDAIHTNSGSALLYGGTFIIDTIDDGIHADTNLKIAGNANINIRTCYEGIEAETIEITGGITKVVALDDGVNATNSNLTESQQKQICQINISGGRLDVTVNPNGDRDGIDSNGGIKITGGTVITRGPNNQNASPIDAANAVSVTGGTVIVIGRAPGSSGGRHGPGGGPSEGTFTTTLTKTQSSTKGLSSGNHSVTVGDVVTEYTNSYTYSGYTTVYASATATIN